MIRRRFTAALGTAGLAAVTAVAFTPSTATADGAVADAKAELLGNVDIGLVNAMAQEFDLTATEVYDRLAVEAVAADLHSELSGTLGDSYAGTWLSEDADEIFVAVTDPSDVDSVPGDATAVVVEHGLGELESVVDELNATRAPDSVYGWHIDVADNTVVVEAADIADGRAFAQDAGIDLADVEFVVGQRPELYYVRGGDAYYIDNRSRCSVGFAVRQGSTPGFTTAGHCGRSGASVTGGSAAPGTFRNSVFPGNDAAWVQVGSNETLYPYVNMYSGNRVVSNANEAATGSSVCRSGSTTGWRCGTIQAKNQTVNYAQGQVRGLTRTSACAEPGDSGGSFITGNSAQGSTSGGSGNCSTGGTTYFQPIIPLLNSWNLTLVT